MSATEAEIGVPSLRLNFIALKNQAFTFDVYRMARVSQKEQQTDDDIYHYSLPIEADSDERGDYWISFSEKANFEKFNCTSESNRLLTVKYLNYLLIQSVHQNLAESEYDLTDAKFRNGLDVIIAHHQKGTERMWIEPSYLMPVCKFGFLIDFHFRKSDDTPFDREVQHLSLSLDKRGESNKDFYADKYAKILDFLRGLGSKVFSDTVNSGSLAIQRVLESVQGSRLNARMFVFADKNQHPVPFTGVTRFGPLASIKKSIRFVLIYSASDRPLINELAAALMGRMPEVGFKGLSQVFRVQINGSSNLGVPRLTSNEIPDIVEKVKQEQQNYADSILMPLAVITNSDPVLYRDLKYHMLKAGLAIQVVTTEKIRDRTTFKWAVADIALQIFAKVGGEPWSVVPTTHRCVIFGIGQAHDRDDQGNIRRYFSYLVCTDTTGLYRRSDVLSASDNEQTYLSQLRQKILEIMRTELTAGYTRCVLHVPFKVKERELKAIQDAIETLKKEPDNEQTQFVVLKVNEDTKYFGYADTNSLIPYESTFVCVSNSPKTYLVWFEGLQPSNPVVRKRPSGPIQIEFYWPRHELKEAEERQLLQDAINLAGCNWRGFKAKHLPISIFYCQLIARRLKIFGDPAIQLNAMSAPWFL